MVFGSRLPRRILTDGYPIGNEPPSAREWASYASHYAFVNGVLKFDGKPCKKGNRISSGTFGTVYEYMVGKQKIAVKLFNFPVFEDPAVAQEVYVVCFMNKKDSETESTTDTQSTRMAAFALSGMDRKGVSDGTACIVSPVYTPLVLKEPLSIDKSLELTRAYFRDAHDIFRAYNLLSFDTKFTNALISTTDRSQTLHACDYGGYTKPGTLAHPTYPSPWMSRDTFGGQRMSEELCVYTFLVTFLSFMRTADIQDFNFRNLENHEGRVRAREHLMRLGGFFPEGPIRDFVIYAAVPGHAPTTMSRASELLDAACKAA